MVVDIMYRCYCQDQKFKALFNININNNIIKFVCLMFYVFVRKEQYKYDSHFILISPNCVSIRISFLLEKAVFFTKQKSATKLNGIFKTTY